MPGQGTPTLLMVRKKKGEKMKDSKGNEFGVGDKLSSIQTLDKRPLIRCIAITGEVAIFERIDPNESIGASELRFQGTQKSISNSQWIKAT